MKGKGRVRDKRRKGRSGSEWGVSWEESGDEWLVSICVQEKDQGLGEGIRVSVVETPK